MTRFFTFLRLKKTFDPVASELTAAPRNLAFPDDLHASIMSAVRHQRARAMPVQRHIGLAWLRWIAGPGIAACLTGALVIYRANLPKPAKHEIEGLSVPISALTSSQEIAGSLPATVAPLSNELTRIQQDLDRTQAFLLSSLP